MRRLLPLAALLAGCTGPDLSVDPRIVPGTGETEFRVLTEGINELPLVNGVQGGTHVWGAVRAVGLDWTELLVRWELTDADGAEVTDPTNILQALQPCPTRIEGCEPGMGEIVAVTLVLESPGTVVNDELTLTVTATDPDGRTATEARQIRPVYSSE